NRRPAALAGGSVLGGEVSGLNLVACDRASADENFRSEVGRRKEGEGGCPVKEIAYLGEEIRGAWADYARDMRMGEPHHEFKGCSGSVSFKR
ncbi:hypothetical protein CPC08DRAFT_704860, partial [Agrocybe pediades]